MPELRDAETTAYIRALGAAAVRAGVGPKYPYTFSVADYREINAFALPGGPVWIHRGVLHAATNESQVAGVLAHEIAHIAQRHAAGQLTKAIDGQLGLGLLGAVLGNSGGAGAAQVAAGLLANGMFLKFSRDDEREADGWGCRSCGAPGGTGAAWSSCSRSCGAKHSRDPASVEMFFSSHPSPQDRIERLQRRRRTRAGGTRDSQQFQSDQGAAAARCRRPAMPTLNNRCPTASPPSRVRTFSSTRTTRSTGIRGARRRSRGRAGKTSRSSCRSATRPVTGAT